MCRSPASLCLSVLSVCVYPSFRVSVCLCVSPSGRGGGPTARVEGGGGPSLPAWLVVLSQSLRGAAHLCEALGVWAGARAGARAAFLWLLHLGQDVTDLPLSQLQDRGRMTK